MKISNFFRLDWRRPSRNALVEDSPATSNEEDVALEHAIQQISENRRFLLSVDDDKNTPLHHAARQGYSRLASLLIEHGAKLDAMNASGHTPLHEAAESRNINAESIIRLLVQKGANVNSPSRDKFTPLCTAAYVSTGNWDAMRVLLELGADPNIKNSRGGSAYSRALTWKARIDDYLWKYYSAEELTNERRQADEILELMVKYGGGVPTPCSECGCPSQREMEKRGLEFGLSKILASYKCPVCNAGCQIEVQLIDRTKGIGVVCSSCDVPYFIPPSVWCQQCGSTITGRGLSMGWERLIQRIG
jgi:Ankyrin repeats (many copies)